MKKAQLGKPGDGRFKPEKITGQPDSEVAWWLTRSACSRSARVCEALMQTRARESKSGVAGKPTTTTAICRGKEGA
jgi:hypothetical protein